MFSKEEKLRMIDLAYKRIIISTGDYESPELKKVLESAQPMRQSLALSEFIKSYKGNSIFIKYESLLQYWRPKRIVQLLLTNMAYADKEFCLYLFTADGELDNVIKELSIIYEYEKEWIDKFYDSYRDDGYVIKLEDGRVFASMNYVKIYPDGHAFVVTDNNYQIEKTNFSLESALSQELNNEIRKKVENIPNDKNYLLIDDREFLRMFVVTYGFDWLGLKCESGTDNKDYFLDEFPSKIIEKIMNLPTIKEIFVNAKYD